MKPHKKGHSGMLSLTQKKLRDNFAQMRFGSDELIPVSKGDKVFSSIYLSHYPGSMGIVGRTLNYIIINNRGSVAGIIGACSPPLSISSIDSYFEINKSNRKEKINSIMNNNVFKILDGQVPNFATMILTKFRKRLADDYLKRYNTKLRGLMTFVEPPRTGNIYRADNWDYLGMTKGYRVTKRETMTDYKSFDIGKQKHIFGYKYKSYYDW